MATYTCRICFEESNSRAGFIVPCRCSGSSKHVHRACLDLWRSQNPDGVNFRRCNTCHFDYELVNSEQDPVLQARRQAEYNEAVAIDVFAMVFYAILAIIIISVLFYWLDSSGLVPIRAYTATHFGIANPWVIMPLVAITLLLVIVGLVTLFTLESIDVNPAVYALMGVEMLVVTGLLLGLTNGIYRICQYVDASRRKHRQRIWLHREAQLQQVRDFGEIGVPRQNAPQGG